MIKEIKDYSDPESEALRHFEKTVRERMYIDALRTILAYEESTENSTLQELRHRIREAMIAGGISGEDAVSMLAQLEYLVKYGDQ